MAEKDIHECGLAGPVLTEQGQNLSSVQFQVYGVISDQRTEGFGNTLKLEKRFIPVHG